jgi:ABC-type lipoprotein export system ATPase subunit
MGALLALRNVSKAFARGAHELPILRDVSLEVHPGAFVVIFGQRSAGKSTLLRIAAGIERPDEGSVVFAGRALSTLSAAELARVHRESIAWVDRAGPRSDELRMLDYVALPLLSGLGHGAAARRAAAALARVGASDCATARWGELADGERMRVALAHGLVREPRVLVLDDPTAGLDVIERERIVGLLRTVADEERMGVLMAVPDMPAMLRAHEVLTLSDGRLEAAPAHPAEAGTVIAFPKRERSA